MLQQVRAPSRSDAPSAGWTLALASTGFGLITLQTTAVNVALPALGGDLGGGVAGLQWVVNAHAIAFASTLLPLGALADRMGAQRVFLAGLVLFAAAAAASATAPALIWLVASQAVAGVSGAMVAPASMALVGETFTRARERAQAIGLMSLGIAGGFGAGPVVGGALLAWAGWRSVLFVNVPCALALIALVLARVAVNGRRPVRAPDPAGVALGVVALGGVTFALIEGGHRGWAVPTTWIACGAAALGCTLFVASHRRAATPLVSARPPGSGWSSTSRSTESCSSCRSTCSAAWNSRRSRPACCSSRSRSARRSPCP